MLLKFLRKLFLGDKKPDFSTRVTKHDLSALSQTEREQIKSESIIGAGIFGEFPPNVISREFFNLDKNTWVWGEKFALPDGSTRELVTKYEVQQHGVLKTQPDNQYSYIEGAELKNFAIAVREYYSRITSGLNS